MTFFVSLFMGHPADKQTTAIYLKSNYYIIALFFPHFNTQSESVTCNDTSFLMTLLLHMMTFFNIIRIQVRLGVLAARIVMLCMTFFFCAPLQSAGGFILEGDWTPTKTNLLYSPPIEVGVLSTFKINSPAMRSAQNIH